MNENVLMTAALFGVLALFNLIRLWAIRRNCHCWRSENASCAVERQRIALDQRELGLKEIMEFREKDPGYLALLQRQQTAIEKLGSASRWMVFHSVMLAISIAMIIALATFCYCTEVTS